MVSSQSHYVKIPMESSIQSETELDTDSPKLMKITCLTIGTRGDVQPYIALCQRLNQLGHTCTIATHKNFKNWIESKGILFAEIAGDPEELIKHCVEFGVLSPSFWWKGFSRFSPWFDGLLSSSWKACQGSDLIIESPSALVGVHIAQSLNIPYYRAFTMPWTKTGLYPHAMVGMDSNWGTWINKMSYLIYDLLIWTILSRRINHWRESELGLGETTFSQLRLDKVPFLYCFSSFVVPRPDDWMPWVRSTGYWFFDSQAENDSSEKELQASIPEGLQITIRRAKSRGKKIIYIGFGSVIVPDAQEVIRTIISSVEESNVFAIISGGWTADHKEKLQETSLSSVNMKTEVNYHPDSMYYVDSIPHEWLFGHIDAALHHGGAGTTAASIRAGIPTLIKPFFGDQFFWAGRVEELGIGSHVTSFEKQALSKAIRHATTDKDQIYRAKTLGEKVRRENGVENAVKSIYSYLYYSKHLIETTRCLSTPRQHSRVNSVVKSALSKAMQTFHCSWIFTPSRSVYDDYDFLV